jgi:RNA polymerase sigma factor (sigma-70 family)
MDDWQLLQSYVERDSDTAFRTLVNRYANLVYSVALRRVENTQLAEEVAQAVFILLARKARGFRQSVILSGWLFRTTRFVASHAVRAEQRRQRREQEAFAMQLLTTPDDTWKRVSPVLDEALEHLGETDRNAVLLRFFNDHSHRETAAALGLSEDAAKKRVTRALDKLRSFFAGRGVTLSATALASAVAANAAKAATPEIAASITAKVLASASIGAGFLPPLVSQTLAAWRWVKLKLAGAGLVGGAAVVLLMTSLSSKGPDQSAQPSLNSDTDVTTSASTAPTESLSQKNVATRKQRGTNRAMRFRVVTADNDEPVAFARLAVNTVDNRKWDARFDYMTDEAGVCELPLPDGLGRMDAGIIASGWQGRYMTWFLERDGKFPAEYTLRVQRVSNSMGGWLRDETGKPVAGAEVWIQSGGGGDSSARETPRERQGFFHDVPVATSDCNGRWSCAVISATNNHYYSLKARHVDFAETHIESGNQQFLEENSKRESFRQLWAGTLVTTMERGLTLSGRVTDQNGQPISQAQIVHHPHSTDARSAETDADGKFSFAKLPPGEFPITATATGFAPEFLKMDVRANMEPVAFQLKPGALLRLQIVDEQDAPVADARVGLEQWSENRHVLKWETNSGADGRVEWNSTPPDRLMLYASKPGWCYTRDEWVTPDGEEHKIELQRALTVVGRATDAETGVAIPEVKAFPGHGDGPDEQVWDRGETRHGTNGEFKVRFDETRRPWRARVEAEGYLAATSEPLESDFSGILELKLTRQTSDNGIKGTVYLPDGQTVAGAEVALCTFGDWIGATLNNGHFAKPYSSEVVRTDTSGRFSFAMNQDAHTLIAAHPMGFARVRIKPGTEPKEIRLQPWGRIEGDVRLDGLPGGEWKVTLTDWASAQYRGGLDFDRKSYSVPLDASGRFTMEKVPPGNFYLYVEGRFSGRQILETPVSILPGQTARVEIGGLGHLVVGRFDAGEVKGVTNWQTQVQLPSLQPTVRSPRPKPTGLSPDALKHWEVDFWQSEAGHNSLFADRSFSMEVAPDGIFTAYGVPPGNYKLYVSVKATKADSSPDIGYLSQEVVVPAADGTRPNVFDLGALVLRPWGQ